MLRDLVQNVRKHLRRDSAKAAAKNWHKTPGRAFEEVEPRVLLDAGLVSAVSGVFDDLASNAAMIGGKTGSDETAKAAKPPAPPPVTLLHSYEQVFTILQDFARLNSDFCELVDIGMANDPGEQSIVTPGGRRLWALKISDGIGGPVSVDGYGMDSVNDPAEPDVYYIGTMHGNEPLGMEMCLKFAEDVIAQYNSGNADVRGLVNSTEIWILPLMNPDGYVANTRNNANGVNLNRAFPDLSADSGQAFNVLSTPLADQLSKADPQAPEVAAVMQWSVENNFVLGANLHTGALLVNYPYDATAGIKSGRPAICPDDAMFQAFSADYANAYNATLTGRRDPKMTITNGSDWFAAVGTMQDWHYRYLGTMEVTVELGDIYGPVDAATVNKAWTSNRTAMYAYLDNIKGAVTGQVVASDGHSLAASIQVTETTPGKEFVNSHLVFSGAGGDFYRVLLGGTVAAPRTYAVTISAPGYASQTISVSLSTGQIDFRDEIMLARESAVSRPASLVTTDAFYAAFAAEQESTRATWDLLGDSSDALYSVPGKKTAGRTIEPARVAAWSQVVKSKV